MNDVFGRSLAPLGNKKLFLFDMDGTIYLGDRLFSGIPELLDRIKQRGGRYVFVTNNSSRSVSDYVSKLGRMGITAAADDFFTSVMAAAVLMKKNHPGKLIYVQGTRSMLRELEALGIRVTTEETDRAAAVLVGFDTELTFGKLVTTVKMLNRQLPYYAANPDYVCPAEFGSVPDCGSMCFGLEKATGRIPCYIGKPKPDMLLYAMEKFGCSPGETVVIGDRLYTDIASGINAGAAAVCVLTGEADMAAASTGEIRPDYVVERAADLLK